MNTNNDSAKTTTNRGKRLKKARLAAGISRAELAGLVGCSLASLANIEQGAVPKQSDVLDRALALLDERKAAA